MKGLVIEKSLIRDNIRAVKRRAGGAEIYADLSGNARGLGLLETARLLRAEGIESFIVNEVEDAAALRKIFHEERIMMTRTTSDAAELEELIDLGVVCTAGSNDSAVALNGIAERRGTVCEVQIAVDTGLGRGGFRIDEIDKIVAIYKYMQSLAVVGVFTEFTAPGKEERLTRLQCDLFRDVLKDLHERGYETGVAHALETASLFNYDFGKLGAVRIGSGLSGRVPNCDISQLQKVGYISADIEEIKWVPKNTTIAGITTDAPVRLASLSVGTYHGIGLSRPDAKSSDGIFSFRANKSSRAFRRVSLNGSSCKIFGDVGLFDTLVDITEVNCAVGDQVRIDIDPLDARGLPIIYRDR